MNGKKWAALLFLLDSSIPLSLQVQATPCTESEWQTFCQMLMFVLSHSYIFLSLFSK